MSTFFVSEQHITSRGSGESFWRAIWQALKGSGPLTRHPLGDLAKKTSRNEDHPSRTKIFIVISHYHRSKNHLSLQQHVITGLIIDPMEPIKDYVFPKNLSNMGAMFTELPSHYVNSSKHATVRMFPK